MKQLELDYPAHNYTETSKIAFNKQKPKLLTKRERVFEFLKTQASTNYEIAEELEMTLSSVCARCRELQVLDLVEDWVVNEKPNITFMEACFLTNNFGVA